ncbi:ATP-dependent nuclease [Franconibacter pulveris]|uniref:ATP-dependent nuclease n=1 Tax=Franconibacter pulveris TaxID=435910 RepID=UPI0004983E1D|nr:AAA family ATPase [Franconibacter pulveris]
MTFPITVSSIMHVQGGHLTREITLNSGLTVIVGPNGSGKTHLLRGLKDSFHNITGSKKSRFISAGRMGNLENFRSITSPHQSVPHYDNARHGDKRTQSDRHSIETLDGDFQTLSLRSDILIKVQERLRKLFNRDVIIEWGSGYLNVKFARLDVGATPYSSGREASGLLHLVGLLTALYDDEVGALLIDEPEVSLHPQLQAFLFKEILMAAGHPSEPNKKIIILATHSTEMIKVEKPLDLASLIFCYDLESPPVQIPVDAPELNNRKILGLIARLGQEHKLSLFSQRPLLVEGPSDVIICNALSSRLGLYLEAAGSQLLPVVGKHQLPVVKKLLSLMGKKPIAMADADALADGQEIINSFLSENSPANDKAQRAGAANALTMANQIYRDFCNLVADHWQEFTSYCTGNSAWESWLQSDEIINKKRALFCILNCEDDNIKKHINENSHHKSIKMRLNALLDLLETSGCFILKKGTIENYYTHTSLVNANDKINAAAEEMEHILQCPDLKEDNYRDIVNCLRYASGVKSINEAEALRDLLLAIASPALAKVNDGATTQEVRIAARTLLGERDSIFELEVKGSKLCIDLKTKILDIPGFPLTLSTYDNVNQAVNRALGLL